MPTDLKDILHWEMFARIRIMLSTLFILLGKLEALEALAKGHGGAPKVPPLFSSIYMLLVLLLSNAPLPTSTTKPAANPRHRTTHIQGKTDVTACAAL